MTEASAGEEGVEISTRQHFTLTAPKLTMSRVQMFRKIKLHNLLQKGDI